MAPQAFNHFGQNSAHIISWGTDGAAPRMSLAVIGITEQPED